MSLLIRKLKTPPVRLRGLRVAPREVSVLDARKVCTDTVTKLWQRKWDKTERCTYEFIPVVGTKVLWMRKHDIGSFIWQNVTTI